MKFDTKQHKYYSGIDLHARSLYLCVLDQKGNNLYHRNVRSNPDDFLKAVEPYKENLVVAVEYMFCWYWISYLCAANGIKFVLGHALYMEITVTHPLKPLSICKIGMKWTTVKSYLRSTA